MKFFHAVQSLLTVKCNAWQSHRCLRFSENNPMFMVIFFEYHIFMFGYMHSPIIDTYIKNNIKM